MTRSSRLGWMLTATAAIAIGVAYAQPEPVAGPSTGGFSPVPVGPASGTTPAPGASGGGGVTVFGGAGGTPAYGVFITDESAAALQQVQEKVQAALQKHSQAETDEQRTAAQAEMQQAVAEQFELLMKPREAQIEELKARLEKLTQQLQKRREAKDEIVKLRVQVLISEADGLGFYPEGGAQALEIYGSGYPGAGAYGGGSPGAAGTNNVPSEVPAFPRTPGRARY